MILSPSLLSADVGNLAAELSALEAAGLRWVHWDVMDGRFVPNITFGQHVIRQLRKRSGLFFDVHLMIVVVGIALDGDGLAVFHADQHAAAGAAVTADALDPLFGGIGFGGAGNARGSGHSRQGGAHGCGAEKITSGHLHCHSSYSSTVLVVAWRFSYTFPCMGRA